MNRQADGLGLVGQGALDGLLDPPRAVSGKLAALGRIESFDRLHQADVALVDQIQQRQAEILVIVGDFDHQAQVGLDHLFARFFVALFDAGGQFDFLLRGQQFDLADFAQIKLDGRIAVVGQSIPIRNGHKIVVTGDNGCHSGDRNLRDRSGGRNNSAPARRALRLNDARGRPLAAGNLEFHPMLLGGHVYQIIG